MWGNLVQASLFTGEGKEAQRICVTSLRPHSKSGGRAWTKPGWGALSLPLKRDQADARRSPPNTLPGAWSEPAQTPPLP